ncbi:MAG: amidase [Alsobacter sp.]
MLAGALAGFPAAADFQQLWTEARRGRVPSGPAMAQRPDAGAEERVAIALVRAEDVQRSSNAFVELWPDRALEEARRLDQGPAGRSLHGVPFAYKDAFASRERLPTLGAGDHVRWSGPPSILLDRLAGGGAVAIGATRLDPFCYTATGLNAVDGRVRNPLDPRLAVGGSSSGSAAAVAAGVVPFALGTDTGGSVRIPAALCGIYGLKPSQGLLADPGMAPLCPSQDTAGILAGSVGMMRVVLEAVAPASRKSSPACDEGPRAERPRVGLCPAWSEGSNPAVAAALAATAERCRSLGYAVQDVPLPSLDVLNAAASQMTGFEAFAIHAPRLAGDPGRYPDPCRRRMLVASLVTLDDYRRAVRLRGALLAQVLSTAFAAVDVLLCPTIRVLAPRVDMLADDDIETAGRIGLEFLRLNRPFSLLGLPSLSIPAGSAAEGQAIGLQLIGKPFCDARLLDLADALTPP